MYILSLWMERETVCTEEVAIGRIREANRGLIITQNKKQEKTGDLVKLSGHLKRLIYKNLLLIY